MKKSIALLLIFITVCVFTASSAQEIEIHREESLFYIVVTVPDGTQVVQNLSDDHFSLTELEYTTPGKPLIVITTAADELYVGKSLSDLSQEEILQIISDITVEMTEPTVDIRTAADGYAYVVINETTHENDICDTVMLVNGYFIVVHVYYADNRELTDQDKEIGPAVVETFRFVGNTNS